ncbi:MAG: hypothetical protein IKI94_11895 [Ruminococcus sp.]|nr:hypothetical protein [Ruminococcus sp.]
MISLINAAKELFDISGATLTTWMETIQLELNLLRGIMKNDKSRYKNLLEDKS